MADMNRREFVAVLTAAQATTPRRTVTVKVSDPDGRPLAKETLYRFHISDSKLRTIPVEPKYSPGEVTFTAPNIPYRIGLPLKVPGFGNVIVYCDGAPQNLNLGFAASRLNTVEKMAAGMVLPAKISNRIDKARALLKKDRYYESLVESLWAGEELVFERAKRAIAKRGPRSGFLFGSNAFGYPRNGQPYASRFEEIFNYATLPFYLKSVQPVYGQPNYQTVEKILSWTSTKGILAKGHPLVWFYPQTTPDWMKGKSYDEVKPLALEYARDTVRRFRDRIHAWDIINEAHIQNPLDFTVDQQIDITAGAARAAREGDPTCFRVINSCCTWNDYMARKQDQGRQTVYDYLRMVKDAKVDFEAIGLQYYYSQRDMLEVERSIETFADFGKPLHITELGLPSAQQDEPNQHNQRATFPWHGDAWTETMQADWIEQFYTMAYSKPYLEALTWWDLDEPAFIPNGGLLKRNLEPKESFTRLRELVRSWRAA